MGGRSEENTVKATRQYLAEKNYPAIETLTLDTQKKKYTCGGTATTGDCACGDGVCGGTATPSGGSFCGNVPLVRIAAVVVV